MDFGNININKDENNENEEWQAAGPKFNRSNRPKSSNNSFSQNNIMNKQELIGSSKTNASVNYNKHHVNRIKSLNEKNVKCLVILRGCSGSGKSTLARYTYSMLNWINSIFNFNFEEKLNLKV